MRCALAFVLLAGCDATAPTKLFHRDGSLMFGDDVDLLTTTPADLAGAPDLAQSPDLATAGNCAPSLTSLSFDFEAGSSGFQHDAIDGYSGDARWPFDEWARGTPTGAGPGACHGGTQCWGTYLSGNYVSCERAQLVTASMDLSACASSNVKLVFWHWYNFWTGPYNSATWFDGGIVEFSGDGGATWSGSGASYPGTVKINPNQGGSYSCLNDSGNGLFAIDNQSGYVQSSTGWQMVEIPIPAALRTSSFRARFVYSSGVSSMNDTAGSSRPHAAPGWYVDDVSISL